MGCAAENSQGAVMVLVSVEQTKRGREEKRKEKKKKE